MQGTVTDIVTGKPLSPVTVVNVFSQKSTSTNDQGYYYIPARPGDIITFSFVGQKTIEKVKQTAELMTTINIAMEPAEYALQEFHFHGGNLTRYQIDSVERATTYKLTLQRRPPPPLASPVSAIMEKFNKRSKRAYEFQKVFAAGEIEKFVDTRYTATLVTQLTGLTGDSMAYFMNANTMPYDFARTATELELKMWIRSNYKTWSKARDTALPKPSNIH